MKKSELDGLLAKGKIRGYKAITGVSLSKVTYLLPKGTQKSSKAKEGLKNALWMICYRSGRALFTEQRFHVKRMWRLDFLIPGPKGKVIGVEYEGIYNYQEGVNMPSRHTQGKGFSEDADKYREAALAGITVLRYTARNWKNIYQDLAKFYAK